MITTSEHIYNNIKLNERPNIVEKTLEEHKQRYSCNFRKSVEVKCDAEYLDKIRNEIKNISIKRYNIIGELNKIMQLSKGMIKLIRIIQVKIRVEN